MRKKNTLSNFFYDEVSLDSKGWIVIENIVKEEDSFEKMKEGVEDGN